MGLTYENWKKKQRGRPLLLIISMIGFTVSFGGLYQFFYKPWARKKRLEEAEEFANILLKNTKN